MAMVGTTEDYDNDDSSTYPEYSPFTSVASFGTGSISTASTPDEATTPDTTGLTLFDFHIDEKAVRGPNGPHLFRSSMDSSECDDLTDLEAETIYLENRPPSAMLPFHQSASKLDPERHDTPVPNQTPNTPQLQSQRQMQRHSFIGQDLAPSELEAPRWAPNDVSRWLQINRFDDSIIHTFFTNDISGSILLELQTQDLKELGIQSFGKRHVLMGAIQNLRNYTTAASTGSRSSQSSAYVREVPPTPRTASTMTSATSTMTSAASTMTSECPPSRAIDDDGLERKHYGSRRRQHRDYEQYREAVEDRPGEPVSIVAIEEVLPKLHSCSKGESCRKWQKQQARLAQIAKDLPIGTLNGRIVLMGDPGNPATAPNLIKTPGSEVTPSLIASSDVMGPVDSPNFQLSREMLREVKPRDPQENVRNFLSFQQLSKLQPVNQPGTPPKETLPSPESESPASIKGNPLTENLRNLPKLQIPATLDDDSLDFTPNISAQRTVTPSMVRKKPYFNDEYPTAIPRGQRYAYGVDSSPGDFYRNDPHYGQETPLSEADVPMTAFPIGLIAREESQSVPPNMRFGSNRHVLADPILRPSSTQVEGHHRDTHNIIPTLKSLDERRAVNPIETPEDLQNTPRAWQRRNNAFSPRGSPNDVTHSGWMKKRKTTRILRHEWEDHHFTLQGTQLAMHADERSAHRNSKALESIDVDDYAVACSSLASNSKLTAAFKKTILKRKPDGLTDSAFGFSLIPASGNGNTVDKKALFLHSGKSHHFAVKTRDERIDWMRELMLAKALKRGRESGAAVNMNGNMI
ncbi:hypothetical protein BDV23DRAFT_176430 [Aspergillus alliaceus]|uniref:SAM and PH domain protein n=1 Tax=Petromyces alliaceus TaxID=209559 RepID=A0A5N7BTS0_PETAA|nr:hypothetical protein BDV23DRAFT_176430 [Aspergillus alliaceus]